MKTLSLTVIVWFGVLMQTWAEPAAPIFVGAKGVTATQINVAWYSTNSAGYYRIYRNGVSVGTVPVIPNNSVYKEPNLFQDVGLIPNTAYSYFVTAVDSSNMESAPSSTVTATTRPSSQNGLIPPERLVNWVPGVTVGVPGGIPTDRTNVVDVTQAPYFADKTGASNASVAINSAISAAAANDIVFLPAGTYRLDSTIYIAKSKVTLRGAGLNQTVLDCRANGAVMFRGGDGFYNAPSFPVTAGAVRGSTQITVSDASWMSVGHMLKISVENDPALPVISVSGYPGIRSQNVRITNKNGNVLTFAPALMLPTYSNSKAALHSLVTSSVGMEDLTIQGSTTTTVGVTIQGCYASWVKNVRMVNIQNYILPISDSLNCEIRKCVFEGGDILLPNHAGLLMGTSTGCLIEDNIVKNVFPAFEINSASTGNVFAYNYLIGASTDLNHAPHNSFNLYEGNIMDGLMSDGYYGSDSDETIFRNWITGKSFGIALKRFSRNFSIVGNQIGTDGLHNGVYSFGQPNIGNGSSTGFAVPSAGIYWLDWSPVTGLGITGTITTRASDSECTITLDSVGNARLREYAYRLSSSGSLLSISVDWGSGKRLGMSGPAWTGNVIQLSGGYPDVLPPVGTPVGLWPRAEGFQERDMDVLTTTILKANRYSGLTGYYLGVNESLEPGQTLPNSLYRASKPDFFGSLAWPPFSPTNPVQAHDAIPAGYRYIHGKEPPGLDAKILTVKKDGTGNFTTIQACVDAAKPGDTCLVFPGTYDEHVVTKMNGTGESGRITIKTEGLVTMKGFDINHSYITVDGFDITGYTSMYLGHILIKNGGNYCKILNNTIRDGAPEVYGIYFYVTGGLSATGCTVSGNTLRNLRGHFMTTTGDNHTIVGNVFERQNSMDYIRVFGHDIVFRRNIFRQGNTLAGVGNHPDFVQTFGNNNAESYNMLFEENWIQGLESQLGQLNSQTDLSRTVPAALSTKIHDWVFRNNVFIDVSNNMNISIPGVKFINNTFYRMAYLQSGISFGGTLKRGDSSRALLKNNIFLQGGEIPDTNGYRGYYSRGAASMSREVLYPLSPDAAVGDGIFADLMLKGYVDSNGGLLAPCRALSSVSQFIIDPAYEVFKDQVYDLLIRTVQLDNSIRSTFAADYNYVAESALGYAAKVTHPGNPKYAGKNFEEVHGINGGDPQFQNINDPLGPDGIPFTLDDGLKPLQTSILRGKGEGGADIGAYSCDPNQVIADSLDSDADRLVDTWEVIYFGSIADPRAEPQLDVDGDGLTNLQEQTAGTSPIDSKSVLRIVSQSLSETLGFTMTWQSVSNKTYVIESSSTLTNWTPAASVHSTSNSSSWTDTAPTGAKSFYRVKLP